MDYQKLRNEIYIVKVKKDKGLDDDGLGIKKTAPALLGAFISGNSKEIVINFDREINGFYNNNVYYTDTDSQYTERKIWKVVNKAKLFGGGFCQRKNDYDDDKFFFYGLFLAPRIKFVSTLDRSKIIQTHTTFKGDTDNRRLLDHVQFFEMVEGEKISVLLP